MIYSKKILFIGIDGAPFELVMKWAKEGELPNISRLLRESAYGELESKLDITPPAWSSIYTGKNAGKHGIFDFMHHKSGTYDFIPANSTMRDSEDLWETLSSSGLKVGVLNAPLTFPVRPVNGFLVSGFLTPGEEVPYTYPSSLKHELKKVVPGFHPSSANELQLNLNKDAYVKNIAEELENLRKASLYLMKKDHYDFFGVFVSETDHVQHWFWKSMLSNGRLTNSKNDKYSDVILNTYKSTDKIVGDLLKETSDDTTVILVSDHGGTYLRRFFHTNYFLHSIGVLNFKTDFKSKIRQALYDRGVTQKLYQILLDKKLYLFHYFLRPITLSVADIDWSKTFAYSLGYGQIFLNVIGREAQGVIPKEKAEEVRRYIIKKLSQVVDSDSTRRPIDAIHTKEEIFGGPHLNEGPDIQLVMSEGYEAFPWASIADRMFTENIDRSGTHNTRGIVIMRGKGINSGQYSGATVFDIAPTIFAIMGVPVPNDVDGRVLTEILTPEFLESNPIRFGRSTSRREAQQYELTEQEQQKIEENLRSLGYI